MDKRKIPITTKCPMKPIQNSVVLLPFISLTPVIKPAMLIPKAIVVLAASATLFAPSPNASQNVATSIVDKRIVPLSKRSLKVFITRYLNTRELLSMPTQTPERSNNVQLNDRSRATPATVGVYAKPFLWYNVVE